MKAFLTGGTGFIGKNLADFLLKSGAEVVDFSKQALNRKGGPGHRILKGDICDSSSVEKAMAGCDVVVNLAAESSAGRSIANPGSFMRTNYIGAYVLLEAARKFGVKGFFQMSTDQVYGNCEKGGFPESAALAPTNPYSASKAAADLLALSYFRTYKLPVVIARSCAVFGPYQRPEKLIPLFITNAVRNKPLPVYNDGLYRRQWLFAEDACNAIATAIEKGEAGQVYNIGGYERTNLDIAESVLKLLGKPASLITHLEDKKFYDRRHATDSEKIKQLGWKPRYSFDESLKKTVEWYTGNELWWKPLLS